MTTITALYINHLNNTTNHVICWRDSEGYEHQYTTNAAEFNAVMERAGEPTYTDGQYWAYDRAIEWDDVLPARSIY